MAGAVTKFALSALAALVLVGVGDVVVLRRIGTDEAVRDARQVTRVAGLGIVEPVLTDGVLQGDQASLATIDRVVRDHVLIDPVVRVKLWTPDGTIVYSDRPELIGSTYSLEDDELDALRTGGVKAALSDLSAPENRLERGFQKLLEVYLPVHTPDGHPLLFEAYLRFASVSASGQQIWLAFAPALALALVLLGLVQIPLAWSMARRIRQGRQDREALLQRAIDASNTERRRIARDLHDGVVQDLAGLSFALAAQADRMAPQTPREVSATLREGANRTRQSMRALRTLLLEIYPPNLHSSGLPAALSDLLAPLTAQGTDTRLDIPEALDLSPKVEGLLFRASQEALRNVSAHAEATRVELSITLDDGAAVLVVKDDGRGFTPLQEERARADGHLGLRLLADLATDSGSRLEIRSEPGQGTTVRLEVPGP